MKALYIVAGILMAVSGLISVFNPGFTVIDITWFFGGVLIFVGISGIVTYFSKKKEQYMSIWLFFKPLITVLVGIFLIFKPGISDIMFGYLFGIWLAVTGVMQIIAGYHIHKAGVPGSVWSVISGILQVLVGIMASVNPLISIFAIGMMIGLTFVMYGVTLVITGIGMKNNVE